MINFLQRFNRSQVAFKLMFLCVLAATIVNSWATWFEKTVVEVALNVTAASNVYTTTSTLYTNEYDANSQPSVDFPLNHDHFGNILT